MHGTAEEKKSQMLSTGISFLETQFILQKLPTDHKNK